MSTQLHGNPTTAGRKIVWRNAAFLILTPLAAAVAVPWYALTVGISWVDVAALAGTWIAIGLSVTAGYHRLFTHRTYTATAPVRAVFAVLGGAALENSVIAWAAAHRFHHRHVDTDNDPYNPQEGFFHSHMGWVMVEGPKHDDTSNVPDLWDDPICRFQHRHYTALAVGTNLALTAGLGWLTGRWLGMIVIALLLRIVVTHHFTFLINSAAHIWGSRRWSDAHSARDNWLLSFFTFGEGYHNYHHTFQADYRNGAQWYNWDPSKWLIWTLEKLGLASRLKRSPVDVRLSRLFTQARSRVEARLAAAGHTLDDLRARASAAGETARDAVHARLVATESACEKALADLKAIRAQAHATVRSAGRAARDEVRAAERSFAEARRAARRALREFTLASRPVLVEG